MLLAWLLIAAVPLPACAVPVFRYALERWTPAAYGLTIFHSGPLDDAGRRLAKALDDLCQGSAAPPNLEVRWCDVAAALEEDERRLWQAQKPTAMPWAVLSFPAGGAVRGRAWAGPASNETLQPLLDSPKRRELTHRLRSGDTCVWLFIPGGDAAADAAAEARLGAALAQAEREVTLPKDEEGAADVPAAAAPPEPDPPLRIAFPLMRLSRQDPAETAFIALLERSFASASRPGEPLAVAVFGQGRAVEMLSGVEIEKSYTDAVATFLVQPCSCVVRGETPGSDLLLVADWHLLGEERLVKDREVINLAVLGGATATVAPPAAAPPTSSVITPSSGLVDRLAWWLGGAVLVVAGLALVMRRAARKGD